MATKTVVMAAMSWHVVSQTSSSYGTVTGILVLEISVHQTKIFAGKYGYAFFLEQNTTQPAVQQRAALATLNASGEVLSYCSGKLSQSRYRSN